MSSIGKRERIDELLRKSLLGEELVNTQFHLFSARSRLSGRVYTPRVLCANNLLLAKSSTYFLDLLSSDILPADVSLLDLTDDRDVPSDAQIDAYGYGSDSDLDESEDFIPASKRSESKDRTASKHDKGQSDGGSISSDKFVMGPQQPSGENKPFVVFKGSMPAKGSSVTAVQGVVAASSSTNQTAMRFRSLGSRHILIKDTAFQTWYTLLNYLYTGKGGFLPLSSATSMEPRTSSTDSLDEPKCSAKSMYRLASKIGLNDLRDTAFLHIESGLTEHNILKELSCSLLSTHPELLEMELDVLYDHIGSAPVLAAFPALAHRIANKELPHGANIIVGIHVRSLRELRAPPLNLTGLSLGRVRAATAVVVEGEYKESDGNEASRSPASGVSDASKGAQVPAPRSSAEFSATIAAAVGEKMAPPEKASKFRRHSPPPY